MMDRIAEGHLGSPSALQVEPDVVLIRHADAGKDLNAFVRDQVEGVGAARLGDGNEARRFGVYSAMPGYEARRRCPDGVFLNGDMRSYRRESRRIFEIFRRFTPWGGVSCPSNLPSVAD